MTATPPVGPDGINANDWLADAGASWFVCRCVAVQRARRLVEAAELAFETEEDVRFVSHEGDVLLAEVNGGKGSWLQAEHELVLDAARNR